MAARSPRSPKGEKELTSRVKELEDNTKAMERCHKLAERKRTQELREAKKKLSKEVQAAQRNLTRSEHEASKLAGQLTRTEQQAQQAAARKARETDRLEDGVGRIRQKHGKVGGALRDKMAAVGQARGRLAHAQLAMTMLEEKGIIISTHAPETNAKEDAQACSSGQNFSSQTEKDLHDGETQDRDDLIAKLRDDFDQLREENLHLRENLSNADRRCSTAIRLLAEAQAVLEQKSSALKASGVQACSGQNFSSQTDKDTARSCETFSSMAKDSETASHTILCTSISNFTHTATTQPALPVSLASYPRSYTPRPLPTLLAPSFSSTKVVPARMTSCPVASPLQRYRLLQDKQPVLASSFMEPAALKSPEMLMRREPVAVNIA